MVSHIKLSNCSTPPIFDFFNDSLELMCVDGNRNTVMKPFFVDVLMQKIKSITIKTSKTSLVC